MALRNLLVRVGADISQLSKGLKKAQKDVGFFGRNVTGSMKDMKNQIVGVLSVLGGGALVKGGVQDAMRYEALMATLGESMGASRKEFEKWVDTVGNSFGYSKLQAADTANLLSLNFKQIATDQADLVAKTTKMMETAAVVANKRGMTMQEVSDRIRSAMNQEADGADELGVNVRIAAVKQSQAYQEMANGQPWDQLTENMRKTILYHHILQQVSERLGSTMQDTTAMRMAQFTASLADVRMALGQAFLPIMYAVLPYLNAMAQALYKVLTVVAAFSRSLFGGGFVYKAPKGFADVANKDAAAVSAVGDAAEETAKKNSKAAKAAKKAWSGTFGFDEVNTIKDPEASTGGGGGDEATTGAAGAGAAVPLPAADTKPFEQSLDEMAQKFKKFTEPIREIASKVWGAISGFAIEKFNQISAWWSEHGTQITQAIQNVWDVIGPIINFLVTFIWMSIKGLVDGAIKFFTGLTEFFAGVFTGDWEAAWEGLKKMFFGAIQAIWNFTNLTLFGGIKKLLTSLVDDGLKLLTKFGKNIVSFFSKSWDDIVKGFLNFIKATKQFFVDFGAWFNQRAVAIAHGVMDAFEAIGKVGAKIWKAVKDAFFGAVDWFVRTVITPIANKFEEIKDAFKENITAGFVAVVNTIREPLNDMIKAVNGVKNKIPVAKLLPDIGLIPKLAQGGITNGPTLAMVGDNVGGREVISPLDRLESMLTNSVIQAMQLGNTGSNQNSGDIILNIDGRSFARIVKPFLDREKSRIGSDVRIRTI